MNATDPASAPEQPRVVVIGDALIDEIRADDGTGSEHVGGAALNVAVGLAVLGVPATLIAMVGEDAGGVAIRAHLADHGVRLLATRGPFGTSRAVSVRVDGEPRYTFNEAAQNRRVDFGAAERAAIAAAPLVVTSCFPLDDAEQTTALRSALVDPRERFVIDANPRAAMMHDTAAFRAAFESLAPEALLVKVGDEDSALLYEAPLPDVVARLLGLGTRRVLATAGSRGASLVASDERVDVPIAELPGPVVDTMGAGDATLATVVADVFRGGLPTGAGWTAVLEHAMRVAAATCRRPGALLVEP